MSDQWYVLREIFEGYNIYTEKLIAFSKDPEKLKQRALRHYSAWYRPPSLEWKPNHGGFFASFGDAAEETRLHIQPAPPDTILE